jgi:Rrf2 family protein
VKSEEPSVLALTKKTGYGLIALSHLAGLRDGEVASASAIARLFGVPQALLMNVMKELASAGFVQSVRGAGGGYRLARRPADIRLAELTSAVERPVKLAECLTKAVGKAPCTREQMALCPVADPVHRFHRKLSDFLNNVTLEELLNPLSETRDRPHFPPRKMGSVPSFRTGPDHE